MKKVMKRSIYFLTLLILQTAYKGVSGLRDMHIKVPEAVRVGDTVTLACDYDLEQVALYTIKWYRYEEEFYRYVPKESPPSKVFEVPHISVDLYRSNSKEVTLNNVERETAGEFRCEVSADAPLFHTEIRSAPLLVAEIRDDDPILRTEVQKVAPGAKIRANCTTPGSYPPMNVTWFINDVEPDDGAGVARKLANKVDDSIKELLRNVHFDPVILLTDSDILKIHPKYGVHIDEAVHKYVSINDLEMVTSTISLRAVQDLFKSGKMKLRCLATVYSLFRRPAEVELQEDAPLLALIMVPTTHSNEGINSGYRHSSSSNFLNHTAYYTYILIYAITRLMIR